MKRRRTSASRSEVPRAALIREKRGILKWTVQKLADESGLSVKTIQKAERGEPVDHETLSRIYGAIGLSYDDLILDHSAETPPTVHDRFKVVITVDAPYATLSQADAINKFLQTLVAVLQPQSDIVPRSITEGSTLIQLSISAADLRKLKSAFDNGQLNSLGVKAISFPEPLARDVDPRFQLGLLQKIPGLPGKMRALAVHFLGTGYVTTAIDALAMAKLHNDLRIRVPGERAQKPDAP
jgi:transcriptional regulator with XRE-family HTH domain